MELNCYSYCTPVMEHVLNFKTCIGWDQSSKFVKIYVSSIPGLDGIKEENVTATFTEK